ncbi:hypothetical protein NQ315_003272 [Exocentrus adspersus]|uniref:Activin types I and II receptor domain-containing protein n=1 Tax=Exocentrus adspersus TaxID=1586481 RepID=A0AAV8VDB5_9CUCU|nr:hypothetical protein NQ315_003272 [Exocentrus adspersus]
MYTIQCLDRNLQLPHNNPMFCHSRNSLNSSFVMECCKDEDFCNVNLVPQLMPKPQEVGEGLVPNQWWWI